MRGLIILFFASCVFAKINMKALTESMGQEVIEIGAPIRELPPDIEEEPSAENEGDATTTEIKIATPKEKVLKKSDLTKKSKDIDKIDGKKQLDEEARIEKELADIYKDSIDYKADTSEATHEDNTTEVAEKPIARVRTNFQFQPDSNSPQDIARFRTSIDEISCGRTKLSGVESGNQNGKTIDKEIRIEKDLAADKDSFGYVSESENDLKLNTTALADYNVARAKYHKKTTKKEGYWFGPDSTDPIALQRFRTSQDYFSCDAVKLADVSKAATSGSQKIFKDTADWQRISHSYFFKVHLL